MNKLHTVIAGYVADGTLKPLGTHNGIDIYLAVKHPWMEPDMNPNDPTRSCACSPVIPANPQCDGGDDDEED
jgi:hypothetical protein